MVNTFNKNPAETVCCVDCHCHLGCCHLPCNQRSFLGTKGHHIGKVAVFSPKNLRREMVVHSEGLWYCF